jgi:hypothetical protein
MISSATHSRWPLLPPFWIWFLSYYRTNTWVDWSNFSVAHWGWVEEGSFRWSAPPLIQDGRYGCHLGFRFRRLEDKRLFCGLLGVTGGRFLSMISSVAHPRLPLHDRHLRFGFRQLNDERLGWFIRFFCGMLGLTTGMVLSMISSAAQPRWPLRLPSWIWFPSIF